MDRKDYKLQESLEFPLARPISTGGRTIDCLTLRRATWKDLKIASAAAKNQDQSEMAKLLLCNLASITPDEFDELDLFDACSLLELSSGFLYGGKNFQLTTKII
jgi:hypothetical protein